MSNEYANVEMDIKNQNEIEQLTKTFNNMYEEFHKTMVSKEYFDRIINNMLECIIVVSTDKKVQKVNQAVINVLKYNEDEILGQHMRVLFTNASHNQEIFTDKAFQKLQKYESAIYREAVFISKNNKEIPVFISLSVMKERNKTIGFVCVAQDISIRKKMEKERYIKYQNQMIVDQILQEVAKGSSLNSILDLAIEYILSHSLFNLKKQGAIFVKNMNDDNLTMTAHRNMPPEILKSCATIKPNECFCGKAVSERKFIFTNSHNHFHSSKSKKEHGHYSVPIISQTNNLIGVMNVYVEQSHQINPQEEEFLSDISNIIANIIESERYQEKLENMNVELVEREQRLEKMLKKTQEMHDTLKSTHDQLLQSEKMASIGQLAAGVAHEINNPMGYIQTNLSAMKGYIEVYARLFRIIDHIKLAVSENDFTEAAKTVEEMNKIEEEIDFSFISQDTESLITECCEGISRVKSIITSLRTFSHSDEGEVKLNNIETILDKAIEIAWNEIKYSAELTKHYSRIPEVPCNAIQIGQVFLNIIVNAGQAILKKGTITVKTYTDSKHAYVEISDTGAGIPEEKFKDIFNPFFTTKSSGKGTGLGLSISYNIIKEHGGIINVTSEEDRGTTFTITLPYKEHIRQD